jgi:hypothetical protein
MILGLNFEFRPNYPKASLRIKTSQRLGAEFLKELVDAELTAFCQDFEPLSGIVRQSDGRGAHGNFSKNCAGDSIARLAHRSSARRKSRFRAPTRRVLRPKRVAKNAKKLSGNRLELNTDCTINLSNKIM